MIPAGYSMTLAPGTKRGSYEILAPLGAGGMGEVYRARDTRLRREVAIKALPATLAADPERLARLEREARLLAALNHPNIAAIYGIEESEGARLLVLELVEGETLAERLAAGPLPVEDALSICVQVASGLEAAHERGVIHRDLKPANVKIRPDGSVKILDLGLARALEGSAGTATDPSLSPTITSGGTGSGVILGTAAYMSPEQEVPLAGGAPISLNLVPPVTAGAAWGADGRIVFTLTVNGPLSSVSEAGGKFETVSTLDSSRGEHAHLWPQLLPEGRGILVTMVLGHDFQDYANSQIVVLDPKSGRRTVVVEGSPFALYAAGQIVFVRGGSVFRAPFDLSGSP